MPYMTLAVQNPINGIELRKQQWDLATTRNKEVRKLQKLIDFLEKNKCSDKNISECRNLNFYSIYKNPWLLI
jgi:hypothetical protein